MRLVVAAIGRLKDGGESDLVDRYVKRFDDMGRGLSLGPIRIVEFPESRAASAALRRSDEAKKLIEATQDAPIRVVLDEKGKQLSSEAFAKWIAAERDGGTKVLSFLIGGPDGHGEAALAGAKLKLSLGLMTMPHGLTRVILVEQLYRAATILARHPYHRSG
jgi:23S rRNA (pseudouridine1915-N3)-methyltransferase